MDPKLTSAQEILERAQAKLDEVDLAVNACSCERCGYKSADLATLAGGYEARFCRTCRNAWSAVADESGLWLEYQKAVAFEEVTRAAQEPDWDAITKCVEERVLVERKLFQFAVTWIAAK